MLNIGPLELIVIAALALLVVGPKRLPELGKTIGRSLREFRKAQDDIRRSFDIEDPPVFPSRQGHRVSAETEPPPPDQAEDAN